MLSGEGIKHKKELCHRVPFYGFPIGTISKVKKIVLGLRYKGRSFILPYKIFFYVMQHSFLSIFAFFHCLHLQIVDFQQFSKLTIFKF